MQCQSIIWVKQVYLKSQYNCRAQGFPSSKLLGAWVHLSGEWSIRVETCKQTGWEGEMRKLNQNIPSSRCYLYSHCGNAACEDIEVGLWTYQKRRSPFRQCKQWKQEEIETKSWCYPELDLFEKGLIIRQEDEDRASTALKTMSCICCMWLLGQRYPLSPKQGPNSNREWKGRKIKARSCMSARIRMLEEANQRSPAVL